MKKTSQGIERRTRGRGTGGQDVLIAGNGNNQIYANTPVDLATALAQQKNPPAPATGQKGDLIAVGDGTNTIVGGSGSDILVGGMGADVLNAGDGGATAAPTHEAANGLEWRIAA